MKKTLFITLLLISTILCNMTQAFCSLAPLENATYCEYGDTTTCCVAEYNDNEQICQEVWCYQYNSCTWKQEISVCK